MGINIPVGSGRVLIKPGGGGGGGIPAPTTVTDLEYTNNSLLMHFNGVDGSYIFNDSSTYKNSIILGGLPTISTTQSKFDGSSGYFNGSNYLKIPYSSQFDLSGGDFTIEAWFYCSSFSGNQILISKDTSGSSFDWCMLIFSGGTQIAIYTNKTNSNLTVTVPAMSTNQWYHIAIVRYGGTNTIYLDGTSYGSNAMAITNDGTTGTYFTIGCASWNNPNAFANGYIDELRISKGIAHYTANFTPPTLPFSEADPTKLPSNPQEGQVVYANVGKTTSYICTNAVGPVWTRFVTI